MKKHIILLTLTVLTIILCSCSSDEGKDTYFIHAIGIDKENGEYILLSLCEKFEKEEKEYFLIKQSGNDIEDALDKTRKEYKDCYFETVKFYFISSECGKALISDMAKEICDSNILPSKSDIYLISGQNVESFMKQIKSGDDIKKIKKETDGKSTNAVSFFSRYTSGKDSKAITLSRSNDGTITSKEKVISPDRKEEQSEHIKR